jgi:hypothetical protein
MAAPQWTGSWIYDRWGWLGLWAGAVAVLVLIVFVGEALKLHPWAGTSPQAVDGYGKEQCEWVNTNGFVVQQANFWSNLGYLAAGLIIFLRNGTFIGRGTGVALGVLFVGSSLFHGTLTSLGQYLDIIGIYMALLAIGCHGVFETWALDPDGRQVPGWFCFVMALGVFAGFTKNVIPWHDSTYGAIILGTALAVIGGIGGARCFARRSQWVWPAVVAAVSFGLAVVCKFEDGAGKALCGGPPRRNWSSHQIVMVAVMRSSPLGGSPARRPAS